MSNVGRRRRVAQKQMRVVISCMRVIVTNIQKNTDFINTCPLMEILISPRTSIKRIKE